MQMKKLPNLTNTNFESWIGIFKVETWKKETSNMNKEIFLLNLLNFPNLVCIQSIQTTEWTMKETQVGFIFFSVQSNLLGIHRIYAIKCSKTVYNLEVIIKFHVGK